MFFTKEWLEKRYSYVVYRRGSGYLGVQISSGGRNRETGKVCNQVSREYPLSMPHTGWSEQDPSSWWQACLDGIPALVEVYATTLHYAPCHTDPANGFKVLAALPKRTNTDKPNMPIKGGDDAYLWACNKWLLAHPDSAEAA